MVAAADGAERGAGKLCGKSGTCQGLGLIASPRRIEPLQGTVCTIQPELANRHVSFQQCHAAANVAADQMREQLVSRPEGSTHGDTSARVKVRQAHDTVDAIEACRAMQLLDGDGVELLGPGGDDRDLVHRAPPFLRQLASGSLANSSS